MSRSSSTLGLQSLQVLWPSSPRRYSRRKPSGGADRSLDHRSPVYSIDAVAVIYMVIVMTFLRVALRFVRPMQMVFKLDR